MYLCNVMCSVEIANDSEIARISFSGKLHVARSLHTLLSSIDEL